MSGYETMACGFISVVDGRPTGEGPAIVHKTNGPVAPLLSECLVGFATCYLKTHETTGGPEVMSTGCFSASLLRKSTVTFLAEHKRTHCYGSSDTGELELFDTAEGLAFKLTPRDDPDGRQLLADAKAGKLQMSCGYRTEVDRKQRIGAYDVRFIDQAVLQEISAVARPAVKETTITVVPASSVPSLRDCCRSDRIKSLAAAGRFEHAMANLRALVAP